jgi:two-component system, chemotaxis family, response regulator Rcp1
MNFQAANILLIEDSPADARYTQLALQDLGIANKLTVLADGEEAIFYLYKKGKYADAARPDCILLDWNLPKADGSEVLEIIRKDSAFDDIPIVVLTGSSEQTHVIQAYHLKANGYITKPIDLSGVHTIMECCDFRIVLTPNQRAGQVSAGVDAN